MLPRKKINIIADNQLASLYGRHTPSWIQDKIFAAARQMLMQSDLSDLSTHLSFTIAAGPHQQSSWA
jgi:hypothetical protein